MQANFKCYHCVETLCFLSSLNICGECGKLPLPLDKAIGNKQMVVATHDVRPGEALWSVERRKQEMPELSSLCSVQQPN